MCFLKLFYIYGRSLHFFIILQELYLLVQLPRNTRLPLSNILSLKLLALIIYRRRLIVDAGHFKALQDSRLISLCRAKAIETPRVKLKDIFLCKVRILTLNFMIALSNAYQPNAFLVCLSSHIFDYLH